KPYTPGDQISFICDTCYQIGLNENEERDADIVCGINELWDGSMPVCELMQCMYPMLGEGVEVIGGTNDCGASISFGCKEGYIKAGGNDEMMCLSNGTTSQWNGSPLTCKKKCPYRMPPENGSIDPSSDDPIESEYIPGDI
ncbi:unnamed protein product, partial [Owenia fusiformis]